VSALVLTHARFQLIETARTPIAVIGSAFWPAASLLAFVVPFVGDDPVAATYATASMVTFAVMSTNLFQYGVGVADDRVQPWEPYVRTLPAGALPRFAGRLLSGDHGGLEQGECLEIVGLLRFDGLDLLALRGHDVGAHLIVEVGATEARAECGGSSGGGFGEAGGVARLDLAAQRRALAQADRDELGRRCA